MKGKLVQVYIYFLGFRFADQIDERFACNISLFLVSFSCVHVTCHCGSDFRFAIITQELVVKIYKPRTDCSERSIWLGSAFLAVFKCYTRNDITTLAHYARHVSEWIIRIFTM